jgi:hypothetical protein
MGQKILWEVAKGLIIVTVLFAVVLAEKYHLLDWSGIIGQGTAADTASAPAVRH